GITVGDRRRRGRDEVLADANEHRRVRRSAEGLALGDDAITLLDLSGELVGLARVKAGDVETTLLGGLNAEGSGCRSIPLAGCHNQDRCLGNFTIELVFYQACEQGRDRRWRGRCHRNLGLSRASGPRAGGAAAAGRGAASRGRLPPGSSTA